MKYVLKPIWNPANLKRIYSCPSLQITWQPASWRDFPFLIVSSTVCRLKGSLQRRGVSHSWLIRWMQLSQDFHLSCSSVEHEIELELKSQTSTASQMSLSSFTAFTVMSIFPGCSWQNNYQLIITQHSQVLTLNIQFFQSPNNLNQS